jgi:hypothetical protein
MRGNKASVVLSQHVIVVQTIGSFANQRPTLRSALSLLGLSSFYNCLLRLP